MPYIPKRRREELDKIVASMSGLKFDGDLNYILYALCKRHVDVSYNNIKNFLGELGECEAEIRRRILGPYEDDKIIQNGDV